MTAGVHQIAWTRRPAAGNNSCSHGGDECSQPSRTPPAAAPAPDPLEADDLSRAFDDELAKLPEEMRRAVVLCELQGVSRREAARQLRISEGTLSSRLGRARKKLAAGLAGRGFALSLPAAV